ncbi:unnamed protein product [Closterium sp. NIES-53]
MASLRVLVFDHEGIPILFDTWLDDLQLYLLSDSKDSVSLFDLALGAATAPPAIADSATRSQCLTRDAAARLAIRNHLPFAECAHFGQHKTAQALYAVVVARYSSPATAAPGRLLQPYLDHFLSLDPTSLTSDLLEQHLLAAETSAVAVGDARGTPRPPFFEGCSPSPFAHSYVSVAEDVGADSASAKRHSSKGQGGRDGGGGSGGGGGSSGGSGGIGGGGGGGTSGGIGGSGGGGGGSGGSGGNGGGGTGGGRTGPWHGGPGGGQRQQQQADLLRSRIAIFDLDFDAILSAMYALSLSAEGDCYRCVPPDLGIVAVAVGASESGTLPGTAPTQALHTFTLDSDAMRCFFYDSTTLTPLPAPLPVRLAGPSGGPVVARSSTVLPCPAVPSGSLSRLNLSFSMNLVSTAALQDAMATTTTPGGSSLYTLATEPSPDQPVLRLHSDRSGEFSSNLLRDFCRGEGILLSFTLPDSPQQNGIAERRIGLVMEVARTSMIHAAAPQFLWPFAVRYAAHQLNLWPRVSLPETSPTLRWTGEVGDASMFRVWGSRSFVRDTSADKLSARAIPYVFLGFVPDAPGWQFYHPTSCHVLPSQDVTFDESVPFYCLFPYRSAPPSPPLLFLAPGPPPVDPLPPQGRAPSGVSQVDPLPSTAPVNVAVGSGAARGAASGGAASGGAEPGGAGSEGAGSGGAEPEGVVPGSPQQLREWLVRRLLSGATGVGGAGDAGAGGAGGAGAGGAGVTAGAGGAGGTSAAGPGGARTKGAGAAGTGGVGGARAGDPLEPRAAGAGGSCAGGAGPGGAGVGVTSAGGAGAARARAVDPGAGGAEGTVRPRPYFVPLLQQVLGVLSSTSLNPPLLCPPPDQSQPPLLSASPLLAPSPYTEQSGGLRERREPASRPVSPVRTAHRVPRLCPPPVPGTHVMVLRPSSVPLRVPLPAPPQVSLPGVPDHECDRARVASPIVSRLLPTADTDPSFESAAASALVAELLHFAAA